MQILDIIKGHKNEIFNLEEDLSNSRLKICHKCPIYSDNLGGQCNGKLWLNPETNEVSAIKKEGYYKGCNCRLRAKTRVPTSVCPANKW